VRNTIDLPYAMPAVGGMAKIDTIEIRERHDGLGRAVMVFDGFQHHGLRLKARNPE